MLNKIVNYDYEGNQISFEKGKEVMINLTSMAKPFPEKNLTQIINSQEINDYCNSLSKLQNHSFTDLLIVKKGAPNLGGGTWAHRLLALRVAQKLNSDFAVWVDMKVEELLRTGVSTVSNDDEAIAYAMQVLNNRLEQASAERAMLQEQNTLQSQQLRVSAPKVEYFDNVMQSVNTYTTTQVAKEMGMDAQKLNRYLRDNHIVFRQSGQWLLTCKHQNQGYTKTRTQQYTRSDSSIGTSSYTVWTEKGRAFLHSIIDANNN